MIRLSGLTPGEDIEIAYTGLRPGEKMYEELFYDSENRESTSHKKIFIARYPVLNANEVITKVEKLIHVNDSVKDEMLESMLQELVPYSKAENTNVISIKDAKNL